jgi:hypothetical protein
MVHRFIIDSERKRSQGEMEVAANLSHLQSEIIQKVNVVESMLRPVSELGQGVAALSASGRPLSSLEGALQNGTNGGQSRSVTQRAPRFGIPSSAGSDAYTAPSPQLSPKSADIVMKLGLNYIDEPPDSSRRLTFISSLKSDLAKATNLSPDTFRVNSLSPGSIVAHVTIFSHLADASGVAADLKQQVSTESKTISYHDW